MNVIPITELYNAFYVMVHGTLQWPLVINY